MGVEKGGRTKIGPRGFVERQHALLVLPWRTTDLVCRQISAVNAIDTRMRDPVVPFVIIVFWCPCMVINLNNRAVMKQQFYTRSRMSLRTCYKM